MEMPSEPKLLPPHGRIACNRCFGARDVEWGRTTHELGDHWSIANNPMSWGSRLPTILVLGFSKGGNQNDQILSTPHDEVAFKGGRTNLSTILETLGLKAKYWSIDELISCRNGKFAFGSLVRCSVKKRDGNKWLMSGKDIMSSCLRDQNMGAVIDNCVSEFIEELPASVRLVVMLGNDLRYVEGCYSAIRKVRPNLEKINAVAYADEQVTFVHTVHFKAQGALVPNWATSTPGRSKRPETDQPRKRELAQEAITRAILQPLTWKNENGKLYHSTSSENRESIQKHGLLLNPDCGEAIPSITGGFFFSSKQPLPTEHIDVWEVNAAGLRLQMDDTDMPLEPDDTWWVLYGHSLIEPWRLKLVSNSDTQDPI
ncbi:MAG TPA: hypothetical protein VKR55_01245 [Bradyrhizobium sp.]|uniref:hypothetical protein n=1 Tax=Bradyrhizobium sp. TaxID=376 RepID=UPI002B5BC762|nr:hypothetical protein [Bradyrhizobium sp.]HLZ00756.1 hypothetical protein [Bradyrhizobium sp.]